MVASSGKRSAQKGRALPAMKTMKRPARAAALPLRKKVTFVCAAGAGGGRSRQMLLRQFGEVHEMSFRGTPNLTTAERETPFLQQIVAAAQAAAKKSPSRPLFLVGHSFGARAAVHLMCRKDLRRQLPRSCQGIIAFGYPLIHPTQKRENKLMDLPVSTKALFISGTKDPFSGDFKLFEKTLKKLRCKTRLVKVLGGDHGLKCARALEEGAVSTINDAVSHFV
ncbi:unnamed protein product [Symbiodinium natans]|uniref:KANL3/Tex30 alpha/beta hydrolase-like domain-containing protein n=1 Tax=Symbiodinium natans TaxID=878477 RepID=A0A812HF26_9DINO|nr:unnamed protein product [Symbiodinium natans]